MMAKVSYNCIKNYKKVKPGVFFKKGNTGALLADRLNNLDTAIFDLDGTIYPSLFVLDLTRGLFSSYCNEGNNTRCEKLKKLNQLVLQSDSRPFYDISRDFVALLAGESYAKFKAEVPKYLPRIYPAAQEVIAFLKKKNTKCYLFSLTPTFIAEVIGEKLKFDGIWAVPYRTVCRGKTVFAGDYTTPLKDFAEFKAKGLEQLKIKPGAKCMVAGNSNDDLPLFSFGGLKIAVNPAPEILLSTVFDLVLISDSDPWQGVAEFLSKYY